MESIVLFAFPFLFCIALAVAGLLLVATVMLVTSLTAAVRTAWQAARMRYTSGRARGTLGVPMAQPSVARPTARRRKP